jgi:predicted phosphoribosyltransferase
MNYNHSSHSLFGRNITNQEPCLLFGTLPMNSSQELKQETEQISKEEANKGEKRLLQFLVEQEKIRQHQKDILLKQDGSSTKRAFLAAKTIRRSTFG